MKQKLLRNAFTLKAFLLVSMIVGAASGAWAQTYKLEKVTSVAQNGLYVFEQDGYVMKGSVSSSALQTTNSYKTSDLSGTENYVWNLVYGSTIGSYYQILNVDTKKYITNSSSTNITLGDGSHWAFNFQEDGTVLIQNKDNSDRFLGYTNATSHAYKAYATSNLSSSTYPHAINVYQLVAEGGAADESVATSVTIDATGITNTDVYTGTDAGIFTASVVSAEGNVISDATVTWASQNTNVATIDASTGEVTLVAAGTTVITASYAGVEGQYKPSSNTYTLIVTDSTPFAGGDVTFVAGTDLGTTTVNGTPDEVSKAVVTMSSTDAAFATAEYRLYKNSQTTFTTSVGKITQIVFTCTAEDDAKYGPGCIDELDGYSYSGNTGTWIGRAESVTFTAATNQVRATQVVVTVDMSDEVGKKDPELSFSTDVVNAAIGVDPELPTLNTASGFDGNVEYSSSDETVAIVTDVEAGDLRILKGGSTTITATFAGNDNFTKGSASYTLNVSDNRLRTTVSYGPIELDIDDVATLTRLAPVVIDAEGNIVEYSYDGWPTEMSFVIVSDDNSLIGSIDNNTGEIILNKAVGTATLKAQYNYYNVNTNYQPSECTFTITVVDPNAPGGRNNPYSVAEAIDYIGTLGSETSPLSVYVSGIVSTAPTQTPTANGELSYYISDDGAAETQLQVYKGKGVDNAAFTAQTDIQVGDEVTVVGKVKMYKTTPEFDAGNYLVSLKRKQKVILSFEKDSYEATVGQDFEEPTLSVKDESGTPIEGLTITYTYNSEVTPPAVINELGEVTIIEPGEIVFTAVFAGNDIYQSARASYTLIIKSQPKPNPELAFSENNCTVTIGADDNIFPTLNNPYDVAVKYTSSNTAVATVGGSTGDITLVGAGEATITASFEGSEEYEAGKAEYVLTVNEVLPEGLVVDALEYGLIPVTGTSYDDWSGVEGISGTVYAGNSAAGNNAVQLRTKNNNSGIVTTASCGSVNRLIVEWNSNTTAGRKLNIYGSNTAYTSAADLYDSEKQGTLIGTTEYDAAKLVATIYVQGNYQYIGIRSDDGALYLNKVSVGWLVKPIPSITLKQYEYNVNADGGNATLPVTCTNMPEDPKLKVEFVEADGETAATYGWITAVINGEGNIAGHMDANTGEARTAYFVVTGVDGDENVVISQLITIYQAAPAAPSITVEKGSIDFAASGESDRKLSFGYESLGSNPTFEICFFDREGNAATYEWVTTATIEDNKVNLAVAANDGEARAAYFKVHAVGTEVYSNLVTINQAAYVVDFATLPFSWDGGASVDLKDLNGVTTNGLGSDYGESHKPYLVKFDGDNDYIQVKTDSRPGVVSVGVKMIGGGNTSKITVQESVDGVTFTDVQELAISGKQNDILTLETANAFAEDSRYVRLTFTKGSNIGVGPISIAQYVAPSTEPSIEVRKTEVAAAAEGTEGIIDVTYKNITNVAADVKFVDAKGEAATYDWIDADINEESNVVYVIGENTDKEARTAYMQVHALDDEANDVYSEIITVTQEGYVAPLPAVTYSLATTITSGKHYLIVGENNGVYQAMGEQKSNNRAAVNVTLDGDKISITDEAVKEVVICGPDVNGFYTIYESGYLYAASSGSNNLKSATTADTNGLWQIDFNAATGEASVIASGSLNRNVMQYNATSSIFSCYASASQKPVYFYERDDEETPVASYTRDVASVKWGTICLPNTATITGAQLYSIAGKDKDEDPSTLYLTEVKGTAAAGTPYIFKPTASVINAYYTGEATTIAGSENGLIGSFDGTKVAPGMYLLSEGAIKLCGEGCSIGANRAYINMDDVLVYKGGESGVKLFIGGEDGVSSLDAATEGAVIYDLSGRRVSKTAKGLYIINGKKVSVK